MSYSESQTYSSCSVAVHPSQRTFCLYYMHTHLFLLQKTFWIHQAPPGSSHFHLDCALNLEGTAVQEDSLKQPAIAQIEPQNMDLKNADMGQNPVITLSGLGLAPSAFAECV